MMCDNLGYDAKKINWARLWERIIASIVNIVAYGAAIIAAKALGIL